MTSKNQWTKRRFYFNKFTLSRNLVFRFLQVIIHYINRKRQSTWCSWMIFKCTYTYDDERLDSETSLLAFTRFEIPIVTHGRWMVKAKKTPFCPSKVHGDLIWGKIIYSLLQILPRPRRRWGEAESVLTWDSIWSSAVMKSHSTSGV